MNESKRVAYLLAEGPVVVFSADPETLDSAYISPNIAQLLGYTAEEYLADPAFWRTLIHPEDGAKLGDKLPALYAKDRLVIQNRLRHKNGRYIHVQSTMVLVRNEAGEPEEIIGFASDQTDVVEHDLAIQQHQHRLEDANEAMEQYVYIASHDLREPLIGVAGFATLLQKRYGDKLDDQGRHFLTEIVRGCKSMEQKIDDLLELSRAGRGTPNGPFPLGAAVEQARRSLVGSIGKSGAVITFDNLPLVRGDRSQIAQVFQNLFSNSIKYQAKDATPNITVTAETYAEDPTCWVITVKDNGIGFDMAHADRIFGVFQRLYTVDQYPGTGIGLAIVKKIIDKHGGKIWVLSQPGIGTTFYFTLAKTDP